MMLVIDQKHDSKSSSSCLIYISGGPRYSVISADVVFASPRSSSAHLTRSFAAPRVLEQSSTRYENAGQVTSYTNPCPLPIPEQLAFGLASMIGTREDKAPVGFRMRATATERTWLAVEDHDFGGDNARKHTRRRHKDCCEKLSALTSVEGRIARMSLSRE